jgi:aminoglycoside 3-N-acetyltransferase
MIPSDTTPSPETTARIARDLRALGVQEGDVLLVHSSLSSMGYVPGGAETVVRGLLEALGNSGTLLMPALTYEHVTSRDPVFDVRRTPSNVGAITEYFRTRAGTRRSLHPTHSVCAVGVWADMLLRDHELDRTPCGPHSPFHRLRRCDGKLLMLGCGLRPNTSMHAIEEMVDPPYLFGGSLSYHLIDWDGQAQDRTYLVHGFNGYRQRYERIAEHLAPPDLVEGPVLEATVHLIDVPALWDAALAAYRDNPLTFVHSIR